MNEKEKKNLKSDLRERFREIAAEALDTLQDDLNKLEPRDRVRLTLKLFEISTDYNTNDDIKFW